MLRLALTCLTILAWPLPVMAQDGHASPGIDEAGLEVESDIERIAAPLPRLFPHWDRYLEMDAANRSHFTLAYEIRSDRGVPPEDIRLWYDLDGTVTTIALAPSGRVESPPSLAAIEAAPTVWVNQPEGGMSLSMQFELSLPADTRYERNDLLTGLAQANRAVRDAAGVAALFAPNMKTLEFRFEGPAPEAWAVDEDGERTALLVQEDRAFFRPRDRENRNVAYLEFGRAPQRVLMDS